MDKTIKWSGKKHVRFGIAIDITERKKIEEELLTSEKRYRSLINTAPVVIYTLSADGKITSLNPKFEELTGWSCEEWLDRTFDSLIHPEDLPLAIETYRRALRGEKPSPYELRVLTKSGEYLVGEFTSVPLVENGKIVGEFGIVQDITERKRIENALRESEELFRSIVENSHDAILIVDDNFKIIYANAETMKLSGCSKEEVIGQDFRKFLDEESRALVEERYLRRQKGEAVPPLYEFRIVRKNGEKRDVRIKSTILKDRYGKVRTIAQLLDITEQKRIEKERKLFEERLSALNVYGQNLNMASSMEEIYRLTVEAMEKILGFEFSDFFIAEGNMLRLAAHRGYSRVLSLGLPLDGDKGITVRVAKTCKPALVADVRKDKDYVGAGEKVLSELAVPIKVRRRILGVLNVESRRLGAFDKNDMKLLEILASHAATAIINLKRREILSALNEFGRNLNKARNLNEIYKLTLDAMEKILGFEYASILMAKGKILHLAARRGYSKILSLKLPLDGEKGITVKAAKTGKSILVKDTSKEEAYVKGGEGIRSELAVPIRIRDTIIGVLNVESKKIAAFDEEDKRLLETLASHAATAINNLRRQKTLSALNEYGRSLNAAENLEDVCKLTLDAMEKILGFEFATFFLVEGKHLRLIAHRGYPKKLNVRLPLDGDKGVSVRAAQEGKPIFVPDIRLEKAYVQGKPGMLSELAVPIKIRNRVLGVLNVESERLRAFNNEDKELLETLASHAATAISNLKRRERLKALSDRLTNLMKSSTEIMNVKDMHKRLKVIAKTIQNFGWRRVVISLRDENLEGIDLVTAGLTKKEVKLLLKRKAPGHVWKERLGPKFERFKIGEFYYLPWSDPWIREYVHHVPPEAPLDSATTYAGVPSKLSPEEMVDWHPQDMLYAPLRTPEGRIVGIISMDDPVDGRKPTRENLIPLELFLHQAAITIENAQLIENLKEARKQLEGYAQQLEQKVEERTRELKESQEQLLKAQRFAVIGELAGMVGHDLRNPLTSIAGAQYYLKKRLASDANGKINEMLDLIEKNITYSNKIINDLLDYSREIELEEMERTPKTLIKETLEHVEIPKNIKVIDSTRDEPKIRVDAEKIKRAFINIIKNAVDAMPKGGKLTIKCRKLNGYVEFSFSDTGVGMSKQTMEKLWTPLFTTKAKGMGFGLPICKRFIEAHGGNITVKSAVGKGTTFTVTLPIEPKTKGGEKVWVKTLESSLLTTTKT
ncbi:MAG: GAF domain-containing protein [Candidatus Bathyarchaeia archaeon]